jgi:5-methylcytosine-specific restriction protein A
VSWEGSTRRDRLPSWWPVTVRRILKRDPVCRCEGCIKCLWPFGNQPAGCHRQSKEVDHVVPGDDHRDSNLRGICGPCHGRKSAMEGVAAKTRKSKYGQSEPPHPGKLY